MFRGKHTGITDSMDMSLSSFWEVVKDREAWRAAVQGVEKSWTRQSNWTANHEWSLKSACPTPPSLTLSLVSTVFIPRIWKPPSVSLQCSLQLYGLFDDSFIHSLTHSLIHLFIIHAGTKPDLLLPSKETAAQREVGMRGNECSASVWKFLERGRHGNQRRWTRVSS